MVTQHEHQGPTISLINDASNNTGTNCIARRAAVGWCFQHFSVTWGNDNSTVTGNQIRDHSEYPLACRQNRRFHRLVRLGGEQRQPRFLTTRCLTSRVLAGILPATPRRSITGNTITSHCPAHDRAFRHLFSGNALNTIRGNIVRDVTTNGTIHGIQLSTQTDSTTVAANRIWNIGNRAAAISPVIWLFQPGAGHGGGGVNNMALCPRLLRHRSSQQTLRGDIYDDGATDNHSSTLA